MSAFTNWNGPENCGGGSIPQLNALNDLIVRISNVQNALNALQTELTTHEGLALSTGLLHPTILAAINNLQGAITNLDVNKVDVHIADTSVHVATTDRADWDQAPVANAAIASHVADAGAHVSSADRTKWDDAYADAVADVQAAIAQFVQTVYVAADHIDIKELRGSAANMDIVVTELLRMLKGTISELYPSHVIDFRNMAGIYPPFRSVASSTTSVALLGVLSTVWDTPATEPNTTADTGPDPSTIAGEYALTKSARVYIKYDNTSTWNAIIDMTVNKAIVNGVAEYSGAITGIVSMTSDRDRVNFGLYHGTINSVEHIYLGVDTSDVAAGSTGSFHAWVGGVNFLPITTDTASSGAVTEIATAEFNQSGTPSSQGGQLTVDHIVDTVGHDVVLITHGTTPVLSVGNAVDAMDLKSSARPTVEVGGGQYQMAFLQDLAQSTYWQRSVAVVVERAADLNDRMITQIAYDAAGNVVARDSPNIASWARGIYLEDPAATSGTNILNVQTFNNGDIALVKDNSVQVQIADGLFNGTLPLSGTLYNQPASLVTGTVVNLGTTLVDSSGTYGRISSISTDGTTINVDFILPGLLGYFDVPAYYQFTSGSWNYQSGIAVPLTLVNAVARYVHDITYVWYGPHPIVSRGGAAVDGYFFTPENIMWTAAHESASAYPAFASNPWSDVNNTVVIYSGQLPIGALVEWSDALQLPNDTLLRCDGAVVTQAAYTELYNVFTNNGTAVNPYDDIPSTVPPGSFKLPLASNRLVKAKA